MKIPITRSEAIELLKSQNPETFDFIHYLMSEAVMQKSPADAGLFVWSYWLTETTGDVVVSA